VKVLYLDCSSGISGDMTVGALVDLGVKPSTLEWELSKLDLGDFHMHFDRAKRHEIEGMKFGIHEGATHGEECADEGPHHEHAHDDETEHEHHSRTHTHPHSHAGQGEGHHQHEHEHEEHHSDVHTHAHSHTHHGRGHGEIREMIEHSELSPFVKEHVLSIFRRIAVAEGKIHGQAPEDVTFHEVGALDSIADIVCACVGLEALEVEKVFVSALHDGCGSVECAHGTFPLPAPATLEILSGIPLAQIDEPHELITPTGAAIVAEFGASFGLMPRLRSEKIGYGVGSRDLTSRPNVLRAVLGTLAED
jgi:uncharacterized protein (DUF111 family)